MANSGVYKIINLVNNKVYIGSSNKLTKRKGYHFWQLKNNKHYNSILQNSFNKHGILNFRFEIIENCNEENCIEIEQLYINHFESFNPKNGYNICRYAGSVLGKKLSEETKAKISLANSGFVMTEDAKRHLSILNTGKKLSEETKIKIGNKSRGRVMTDSVRIKISKGNKGKAKSEAHRKALSDGQKKSSYVRHMSEGGKKKLSIFRTGKKASNETKFKLSESHKGKIQSNETIEKRCIKIEKRVVQYDLFGNKIATHNSIKKAAAFICISPPAVSRVLSGKCKQVRGFKFKYLTK